MKFLLIVAIILALSLTISGDENKKAVNGSSIEEMDKDDIDDKQEMEVIDKDDDDYDEDDDEDDFQLPLIATNFTGLVEMENCTVTTFKLNSIFGPMSNFRYKYVQRDGKIIYVYSVYKLNEEEIRRALLESDRIRLSNIEFAARLHAEALKEMQALAKEIEQSRLRFNKMFENSKEMFRINFKRSNLRLNHKKRDEFLADFQKSEEKLQGEVAKLNVVIKDLF